MPTTAIETLFHLIEEGNLGPGKLGQLEAATAVLEALVDYYDAIEDPKRPFPLGILPKIVDAARGVLSR